MRCFEAMGCGALLISDAGNYPEGLVPGETIVTYESGENCLDQIRQCLSDGTRTRKIADTGRHRIGELYAKESQWVRFKKLAASF